ncbi:MAG: polyprenol phosphomannose-dependent alpha 1,6 mannosyltransferase MptB [Candidatus Promineifilaceae bacterium]
MDSLVRKIQGSRYSLWIILLLLAAGYLTLSLWFPLRPNFNISPTLDIRSFAPSLMEGLAYALLLTFLYTLYLLAYRLISQGERRLSLLVILLMALIFCLPLLLTYPINATDIYRYFIQARITIVHNLDPFSIPPANLVGDPYAPLAGEWADVASPYGPLWELVAGGAIRFTPDDLYSSMLIFKSLSMAAFLAGAAVIWLSLPRTNETRRSAAAVLWAWNPSLLLIFTMDGHNDSLMLLWLLLGWLLISRDKFQLGMIVMLLAPLTKAIALLPLPIFFIYIWKRLPDISARFRFTLITAAAGFLLLAASFLPFGSPMDLGIRLLEEAQGGFGFSPVTLLYLTGRDLLDLTPSPSLLSRIGALALGVFALYLLWKTYRGRSPLRGAADVLAGYIVQALNFRIWYASWFFPWLILDASNEDSRDAAAAARLGAGLAFLLTTQLSVVIYGHLRNQLLGGSTLAAHAVGVSFTFLIPLAVGLYLYKLRSENRTTD